MIRVHILIDDPHKVRLDSPELTSIFANNSRLKKGSRDVGMAP